MRTFDKPGRHSEKLSVARNLSATLSPEPCSAPDEAAEGQAYSRFVYDLRLTGGSSKGFYADVAGFSARVAEEIENRAASALDNYSRYASEVLSEAPRSRGEYGLELLTVGMALRVYEGVAFATPGWVIDCARELFWLRRRSRRVKPFADFLRAGLFQLFMRRNLGRAPTGSLTDPVAVVSQGGIARLPRLIEWMQATGEFEQEWRRVENWRSFWGGLAREDAERSIASSVALFDWFTREADKALGQYTAGVMDFLKNAHALRFWREDQIFCGRLPVEYHLGMVAAEVMNEGLRQEFQERPRKVVLVPTCMRGSRSGQCRAVTNDLDMTCTGCDPACAVNRITRRMRCEGIGVYMVPHSSGFSRWLGRWQNDPKVGVAAVACMMNILAGGYEMRARRIASQCVPLDYPGCAKHWTREGVPTGANEERLVQIVRAGSDRAS